MCMGALDAGEGLRDGIESAVLRVRGGRRGGTV